ncbi:hypothetical protein PR048_025220 [Dryococelus australis]|uniref:Mutator-like transposase domain-containing protein n=1 Tax=Dryococelus australis TaxID=614101 RepID=A0ABQ9GQT2_9NEOP|nr:hypothetical protein PR048_025220 [Dryococelus australis]
MPKSRPPPSHRKKVSLRARRRRRNKKIEEQAEKSEQANISNNVTEGHLVPLSEEKEEEGVSEEFSSSDIGSLDSPTTPHIAEKLPDLMVEVNTQPASKIINGRRIVSLQYVLEQHANIVLCHKLKCTGGLMELQKELHIDVFSILKFHCKMCGKAKKLYTDTKFKQPSINDSLVWAATAVGIGHTQAEEMFGILELKEKMELAIQEEVRLAREEDHVDERKTWISVTVDGLASIIGTRTQKLRYRDTQNKFFMIWALDSGQGKDASEHVCNGNFTGASTAGLAYTGGLSGYVTSPWKLTSGSSPVAATNILAQKRQERSAKRKLNYAVEPQQDRNKNTQSDPPDENYGATLEHRPYMSDKCRKQKEQDIFETLQDEVKTAEYTAKLQQATVGQNDRKDDAWCKAHRAESTLCDKLVKQIIVPPILRANAVLYGQHHEESAKKLYEARYLGLEPALMAWFWKMALWSWQTAVHCVGCLVVNLNTSARANKAQMMFGSGKHRKYNVL